MDKVPVPRIYIGQSAPWDALKKKLGSTVNYFGQQLFGP
jgi:hypothetical protein